MVADLKRITKEGICGGSEWVVLDEKQLLDMLLVQYTRRMLTYVNHVLNHFSVLGNAQGDHHIHLNTVRQRRQEPVMPAAAGRSECRVCGRVGREGGRLALFAGRGGRCGVSGRRCGRRGNGGGRRYGGQLVIRRRAGMQRRGMTIVPYAVIETRSAIRRGLRTRPAATIVMGRGRS